MSYNDEFSEITYLFTGNHSSVYDSSPLCITYHDVVMPHTMLFLTGETVWATTMHLHA